MGGRKRGDWVADFETTTKPDDCRVWGWGLCNVEKAESVFDVEIGTDIDSFIERVSAMPAIVYFHNLAFDGSFIIDWLFRKGYRHTQDQYPRQGEFTSLISNMGKFYSITVAWDNGKRTEFRDSLKKLPMSVANVAKAFKQPEVKGDIDYHLDRPVGYQLTRDERNYIARDVLIVARALRTQFQSGMTRLTVGSDALFEFKNIVGKRIFDKFFPVLPSTMDAEIRNAYRGGFTYADERFRGELTRSGRVYDVNSLYPSVMYDRLLPYKEPVFFRGAPKPTTKHPLYIVSITFTAKLKPDHIPCIQVKGSSFFLATEYVREIVDPVTMMCTNVDLELWQDHYDLDILSYNGGWMFEGISGLFVEYIDKWMEVKANNDGGLRTIAKLQLNSLYGKFATNPNVTPKIPVMVEDVVKLVLGAEETRDPVYTAMGVFITAYARDVTVRAAQENYDVFAYADTDSLHLLTDSDPITLEVDSQKLGAWKFEYSFESARFIRAKAYMELLPPVVPFARKFVTHIAGLPDSIAKQLTFEDISNGRVFQGKLLPKRVPGGIVLEETGFTLNL
jgi:hypothetical protein